jgi:hypothetical protein
MRRNSGKGGVTGTFTGQVTWQELKLATKEAPPSRHGLADPRTQRPWNPTPPIQQSVLA